MKTVCSANMCAGCMACIDICPKQAITIYDNMKYYNAIIDEGKCISCSACHNVCQQNHPQTGSKPIYWYQGWAKDSDIRERASSGGIGSVLIEHFLSGGGYVASCSFFEGEFRFLLVSKKDANYFFEGSKYVKSTPKGIYKDIRRVISDSRVLFIGLPCQVSAVKNFFKNNENLYTVDLICHGSPSPKILESFLLQYGYQIRFLQNIKFRKKLNFQIYQKDNKKYKSIERERVMDNYLIAFLRGICYTENCYHCKYAMMERIGDITIGDSWGSDLKKDEQKKGISLILCQTERGKKLIDDANIVKKPVDLNKAILHNQQLQHPSEVPVQRKKFFKIIEDGKGMNYAVKKIYPQIYYKQKIKKLLLNMHIFGKG